MSIFLLSSLSAEESSKNSAEAAPRPVDLHGLCVFEQADRGRELRILGRRRQTRQCLRVGYMRRHFKNFACQMIDPIQQAAPTSDQDAGADVINERFFLNRALEQFKDLAQTQMNDCVKRFPLDLFAGKTGVILKQNLFAGKTIAKNAAALFAFYFLG